MDFKQYKGKNILAWLWFNPEYYNPDKANTVCYVYPRVLVNKETVDLIDPGDFPQHGAIRVNIYGGETAEDVFNRVGSLVSLKINEENPNQSYDKSNTYSLKYNFNFGKTNSEIWIDKFSGKGFYQIIDVNSNIEVLQKERSIPAPDSGVLTTLILLRCENKKLYGPFEYDDIKAGTMTLRGMKDYQYSVGEYNAIDYNDDLLIIEDQNGEEALILIPKFSIPSPEGCEIRQDWISEETLIDGFIDALRVENSYTREQVRKLKEMVHQLAESNSGVQFTDERISKLQALLQKIGQKEELTSSIVQYVLSDAETKKVLAEEVASNHYDLIKDKIPELTSVQERINKLKAEEETWNRRVEKRQESAETVKVESSQEDKLRISDLTQKLEKLREENIHLSEKLGLCGEIQDLTAERDRLKIEKDIRGDHHRKVMINLHLRENEVKKRPEIPTHATLCMCNRIPFPWEKGVGYARKSAGWMPWH